MENVSFSIKYESVARKLSVNQARGIQRPLLQLKITLKWEMGQFVRQKLHNVYLHTYTFVCRYAIIKFTYKLPVVLTLLLPSTP